MKLLAFTYLLLKGGYGMQDSVSVKEKDIIIQENKIFYNTDFISQDEEIRKIKDEKRLSYYLIFWSVMFLIASIVAAIITKEGWGVFDSLKLQLLSPAKLVTDYFRMGSLASTFLNASLCGFGCNFMIWITKNCIFKSILQSITTWFKCTKC